MKWFWIALGKWFDKRNGVSRDVRISWTKIPKPMQEMTSAERRKLAERIASNYFHK